MADQTDTTATETSTTTDTSTGGAAVDTSTQADDSNALGSASTDAGTGDDTGKEDPAAKAAAPVSDDVPEAYELKPFKVGEGDNASEVQIDVGLLEAVTPGLKEAGIKQDQLDKLAPLVPAIQEAALKNMNDEFAATRADWAKQAQADSEIGGKNWTETQQLAAKALDHFTGPATVKSDDGKEVPNEFRKLLNESGLGNHPVMIRTFRKIGEALSEDPTFTRNTITTEAKKSREEANYPNDVPKS